MNSARQTTLLRRVAENAAMAGLLTVSRAALSQARVQTVVDAAEKTASSVAFVTPFRPTDDTLPRARALAYRWSRFVPGANCLHRAVATRLWLSAVRVDSHIVLGFRKQERFEGHAWLEIKVPDAVTLMFVSDHEGYEVALHPQTKAR